MTTRRRGGKRGRGGPSGGRDGEGTKLRGARQGGGIRLGTPRLLPLILKAALGTHSNEQGRDALGTRSRGDMSMVKGVVYP